MRPTTKTFTRHPVSLAAALSLALLGTAACGGETDTATTDPAVDPPAAEEAADDAAADDTATDDAAEDDAADDTADDDATDDAAAADGDAVEIAYLHRLPDGEGMTPVADIVQEWNDANPGIQVTATKFDGAAAEMIRRLETDVRAGNAPCLAQLGYAEVPNAYTRGMVQDVTAEAEQYAGNYSEGTFGMMTVGESVVGLPQDTGPIVYYYNETLFEELGLEVPTDAESFVATAQEAAEQGHYIAAFTPDEATYWLSAQAAAAGDTWYAVADDAWQVTVEGGQTDAVADMWQQLLDADAVVTHNRWDDTFTQSMVDQELIGHIGAAWEAPLLSDGMAGSDNEGQWRVTQVPQLGDSAMSGPDGGSGVAVMEGCEHVAEAMEFNDWFNTQVEALVSQGLVVATTVGQMETPEAVAEFYGGQDVFAELSTANEQMNPDFPYMPTFPAIMDAMTQAASAAVDGTGSVADIFTAAQQESVSSLEDAGLPVGQ